MGVLALFSFCRRGARGPNQREVQSWSAADVQLWLRRLGMQRHGLRFQGMDGKGLLALSDVEVLQSVTPKKDAVVIAEKLHRLQATLHKHPGVQARTTQPEASQPVTDMPRKPAAGVLEVPEPAVAASATSSNAAEVPPVASEANTLLAVTAGAVTAEEATTADLAEAPVASAASVDILLPATSVATAADTAPSSTPDCSEIAQSATDAEDKMARIQKLSKNHILLQLTGVGESVVLRPTPKASRDREGTIKAIHDQLAASDLADNTDSQPNDAGIDNAKATSVRDMKNLFEQREQNTDASDRSPTPVKHLVRKFEEQCDTKENKAVSPLGARAKRSGRAKYFSLDSPKKAVL